MSVGKGEGEGEARWWADAFWDIDCIAMVSWRL